MKLYFRDRQQFPLERRYISTRSNGVIFHKTVNVLDTAMTVSYFSFSHAVRTKEGGGGDRKMGKNKNNNGRKVGKKEAEKEGKMSL